MKRNKLMAAVCIIMAAILAFGACGNATQRTPAPAAPAGQQSDAAPVTLRYTNWMPTWGEREIAEIIEPFQDQNPHITIDFQPAPWGEYWQKLQLMLAAADPPDIFWMSVAYFFEFSQNGMLVNLEEHIAADPEMAGLGDFYETIIGLVRYPDTKGDLFALPYAWVCSLLFYNKDLFDAAGLPYPDETWTWEEDLVKNAIALTKGEGMEKVYGFISNASHVSLDAYINALGGNMLTEDFRHSDILSPQSRDGIRFFYDLIHMHKVSPMPMDLEGQPNMFMTGRAAMMVEGSYVIEQFRDIEDFDWGVTMVPKSAVTGNRVVYGGPDSIAIASTCKNPEQALRFVKYYIGAGRDVSSYVGGLVPSFRPLGEDPEWLEPHLMPEDKGVILRSEPYVRGANFVYKWSEWRASHVSTELTAVLNDQADMEETLQFLHEKINEILAEAGQ